MLCRWAVMAALLISISLQAQTTFTFQEEDDSLVSTALAGDSGYTNGTRMLWSWNPRLLSHVDRYAKILCGHDSRDCERTVTAGIGQNMYTPENLLSTRPLVGDRPYGGWLYGTLMFDATKATTNDHVELSAGVIGRDSHAADAQIFVHKHVTPAAPDPLGWNTQIGEWAALLASYERSVKLLPRRQRRDGPEWFDVTPAIGGAAGNVFVNANATTTVRLGYNLPSHFIVPIRAVPFALRTGAHEEEKRPEPPPNWDAYLYVVANGSYVLRNVFLDANDDTYLIQRRPWVRERRVGASFRVRHFRLAYQYTHRSSEFRPLVHRLQQSAHAHSYGMILMSIGADP
jgi:lipid A 3-O-deacylase